MLKKIFLSLALAGSLAATNASAEESKNISLGFGAGPTIGAGFVGRYEWDDWGVQAAVLPYYVPEAATFLEGITGLYTINKNKHGSFYASFGVVGWHKMTTSYLYPPIDGKVDPAGNQLLSPDPITTRSWTHGFASGPGFGMRFNFLDNYMFSFDLPAAFVFEVKEGKVVFDSFKPWPNVVLMYSF